MDSSAKKVVKKISECQAVCNYCFDSCLHEEHVAMMTKCIALDKECAEICSLAVSSICSSASLVKEVMKLCVKACESCAKECEKHDNSHCRECAKVCRGCAEECKSYMAN